MDPDSSGLAPKNPLQNAHHEAAKSDSITRSSEFKQRNSARDMQNPNPDISNLEFKLRRLSAESLATVSGGNRRVIVIWCALFVWGCATYELEDTIDEGNGHQVEEKIRGGRIANQLPPGIGLLSMHAKQPNAWR